MRKFKSIIAILVIFMTIGFATINYTLSINADTNLTGDLDRFQVYFSNVKLNGREDSDLVTSPTRLDINEQLETVGSQHTIEYTITNASEVFDAEIKVNCTPSNEYLSIENQLDTTTNMVPFENRNGTLIIKRIKTIASTDSIFNRITCNIEATPISRENTSEGTPALPLNPFYIGREITIGTEKFNITSTTDETVTMLAQYNLDNNYRQNAKQFWYQFSNNSGWEYAPGPKEIDIDQFDGHVKNHLAEYAKYIKAELGNTPLKINLLTLRELKELGCTITDDYSWKENTNTRTCHTSPYSKFLLNNQKYWLRSADPYAPNTVWIVHDVNALGGGNVLNKDTSGIRPTITIPKEIAYSLITKYYIGQEITIGEEKFNVISDNGSTISMLAQYNIDNTEYIQTRIQIGVLFADNYNWEYTPGPKEINIQNHDGPNKTILNKYISYIKSLTKSSGIEGNLISLNELKSLGCTIQDNYSYTATETCTKSNYNSWLINGQYWWTRSAFPTNQKYVWAMGINGKLYAGYEGNYGIRPVITISKIDLNKKSN